jgi:diacylglycerol O-acyltransferase
MPDRLRPGDLAFLNAESASTPMHTVTLEIFDPGEGGFDYERLVGLIEDRLAYVPRYRQRLRTIPGGLSTPVWVDDPDFDITFHVRRSAVPTPGSMDQLREMVSRISTRKLDRGRPLWEMYLIEGLAEGRVAILSKSHQTLVDGIATIDIGQVILDVDPVPRERIHDDWSPAPALKGPALMAQALNRTARDPRLAVSAAKGNASILLKYAAPVLERVTDLAGSIGGRRTAPESPLNAPHSTHRLFVPIRTDLQDFRKVRREHGGTVNDVILATITGALRSWLMTRAESVEGGSYLRAMVPMSVIDRDLEPTSLGSQVAGHLLNLPIGENSPVVRLHQVSYALKAHKETGRAVEAQRLLHVAGFAPTTFHALGSRVAAEQSPRTFNLVVTNVPGPQFPLFASGARMLESYPVQPLLPGHALAIGVTSYDGSVYFGLNADRDAMPDVEVFGQCIVEALAELVDTTGSARVRAPRGRRKDPQ